MEVIPDFPKPGVSFLNMWPTFNDPERLHALVTRVSSYLAREPVDAIVAIESRGFPWGALLAFQLRLPLVPVRKPGKLPGAVHRITSTNEYGSTDLELPKNMLRPGQRVLLVDDVLATGGTLVAAAKLVKGSGASPSAVWCWAETQPALGGRERLAEAGLTLWLGDCAPLPTAECKGASDACFQVLYTPSMAAMAQQLATLWPTLFRLRSVEWQRFPDGTPNIKFPGDLSGQRVVFLASMSALPTDNKRFFEDQLSLLSILPRQGVRSLDILIPFYPVGTMERVESPGELATADTFALITGAALQAPTLEGPATISIFDLHNMTTRFCFPSSVRMIPLTALGGLWDELAVLNERLAVVFPDEGSYKRFRALVPPQYGMVECGKDRNTRDVKIARLHQIQHLGEVEHFVIVDDLVHSGGTLLGCVQTLHAEYPGVRVSVYCTHGVFEKHDHVKFRDLGLSNVWITDTVPERAELLSRMGPPFRVLPVAPAFVRSLSTSRGLQSEWSVVTLMSCSEVKKQAVQSAFTSLLNGRFHLRCLEADHTPGRVEQPLGMDETLRCALQRIRSAPQDGSLVVAVESGIDDMKDFVLAVVKFPSGRYASAQSEGVWVDPEIWKEFQTTQMGTVGQIYAARQGLPHDNWQRCPNRTTQIREAVMRAVLQQGAQRDIPINLATL